jgi:hypothetical protein
MNIRLPLPTIGGLFPRASKMGASFMAGPSLSRPGLKEGFEQSLGLQLNDSTETVVMQIHLLDDHYESVLHARGLKPGGNTLLGLHSLQVSITQRRLR